MFESIVKLITCKLKLEEQLIIFKWYLLFKKLVKVLEKNPGFIAFSNNNCDHKSKSLYTFTLTEKFFCIIKFF